MLGQGKNSDFLLVIILNLLDFFILGYGFPIVSNIVLYGSVFILLPRFFFKSNEILVFILLAISLLLAFCSLVINSNMVSLSLEATYLLRLFLFVMIISGSFIFSKKEMAVLRFFLLLSLLSMLLQTLYYYFFEGNGMLLRGDRNHSAIIYTLYIMTAFSFFESKNRILSVFFIFTNFSRNLVVGLFLFFFRKKFPLKFFLDRKYILFTLLLLSLNSIFYFYGYFYDSYSGEVGSSNDISRILVVFDGSNNLRFSLNYQFLNMIYSDMWNYIITTGVYSDLKETLGLYPHNSFLHLLYRVGIIRSLLLIYFLVYFVRSKDAVALTFVFFFQAAFIHEMFLNSSLILLAICIARSNSKVIQ